MYMEPVYACAFHVYIYTCKHTHIQHTHMYMLHGIRVLF